MEQKFEQNAKVIWLTGLPCSGKTTLGIGLYKALLKLGFMVRMLDGDITRRGLCNNLGFSDADRNENIRRVAEVSKLFIETGIITINAFITPTLELRELAQEIIGSDKLIQVYVNSPVEVCEARDVKGMYAKARRGELSNFTGVSAPFDNPVEPDVEINTHLNTPENNVQQLLEYVLPLISKST
ncbi:MAG: adenylyl-sulfate kinase [Lentimicrobium sp.]|jgi:adenylylsulfate kinase|nr:adenylyl-sulfate kinase [Lentimicrobium sp.]